MKYLNTILLLTAVFMQLTLFSQENDILFSYDGGGKLIERKIRVFPPLKLRPTSESDSLPKQDKILVIYPNPTNQSLFIDGEIPIEYQRVELKLITINGQILKSCEYLGTKKEIDVSDLDKGVYFLEFSYSKKNISTYKIIITN